jgi:hypothetical protein
MQMKALRQGDVLLKQACIPQDAKPIKIRPIALGERTGHHHSLMADPGLELEDAVTMFEKDGQTFVRISEEGVSLVHQQHKAHACPPGEYVYVPQVENSDWGTRQVAD